jgi:hypothetical protein
MKLVPADMLSDSIIGSFVKRTGLELSKLEEPFLAPKYYEGDRFIWNMENIEDPILKIDYPNEFTGDVIKIWWNGEYDKNFLIYSNINVAATDQLPFYIAIGEILFGELKEIVEKHGIKIEDRK